MKKLLFLFMLSVLLVIPVRVMAQEDDRSDDKSGNNPVQQQRSEVNEPSEPAPSERPEKSKPSEPQASPEPSEAPEVSGPPTSTGVGAFAKFPSGDMGNAEAHMSAVAKYVLQLLSTQGSTGGIGDQVSTFAKEQNQSMQEVRSANAKISSRPQWVTALIGTDLSAVNALNTNIARNRAWVSELQDLETKLSSDKDRNTVSLMVDSLNQSIVSMENVVAVEGSKRGALGWLVRMFR